MKTILNLNQNVIVNTIFVICLQLIDRMHAYKHIVPTVDEIHKRHVCTKLDIYFCITITGSITLATGGLLVLESIIGPVVSVSITGSVTLATGELLVPKGIIGPVVSVSITWSITLATGGLLIPEGIIVPVVSVSITGSITLATGGL